MLGIRSVSGNTSVYGQTGGLCHVDCNCYESAMVVEEKEDQEIACVVRYRMKIWRVVRVDYEVMIID